MKLEDFLDRFKNANLDNIYIKPNIPLDKAINAIKSYARELSYDDIIILVDDTVFGNCKVGIAISNDFFISKEIFLDRNIFNLNDISDIYVESFVNSAIFIDDKKVITLSQPKRNDLQLLFNQVLTYINFKNDDGKNKLQEFHSNENKENFNEPVDANLAEIDRLKSELAILKKQIERQDNSSSSVASTVNKLEHSSNSNSNSNSNIEIFKFLQDDNILVGIRKNKLVNNVSGFISFFGGESKSNQIEFTAAKFIFSVIEEIRNGISIRNLENNVTTYESAIFAMNLLKHSLLQRDIPSKLSDYIIISGMASLLGGNEQIAKVLAKLTISYDILSTTNSYGEIQAVFYIRLFLSNHAGKIVSAELFDHLSDDEIEKYLDILNLDVENLAGNVETEDQLFTKMIIEMGKEIGKRINYIANNRSIYSTLKIDSDRLFDIVMSN